MKVRNYLGAALTMAVLSGCNEIPQPYQGDFGGLVGGQLVNLNLAGDQMKVEINGKTLTEKNFVTGFDSAIKGIENGQEGVYVLPSVVSVEGLVVNTPWAPRYDLSTIGYQDGQQNSDHLEDVYVVFASVPQATGDQGSPFNFEGVPTFIQGTIGTFEATVLYLQVDKNASAQVDSLPVEVAPLANLGASDTSIFGVVGIKMLNISPASAVDGGDPVVLNGTLTRQ